MVFGPAGIGAKLQERKVTGKGIQRTAFVLLMGLMLYIWLNGG